MIGKKPRIGLAIVVLLGVSTRVRALAEDRPNVVLIVADDLGWADLGCYGSSFHKTPNIDRLAGGGRRFTQAYSASPVCSPTRAAILTGKHPARLHITDFLPSTPDRPARKLLRPVIRQSLALEEVTIAERLKESGYATGIIGKWHLGGAGFEPRRQGFDISIAADESGSPLSYLAPFRRGNRVIPGLEEAPNGEYLTDRLATEAVTFIEGHKSSPFFLYLPHYAPHLPMVAKPEIVAKYPKWDGTPHGRQENPIYAAMLESLDDAVGKVLDAIERSGLAGKTIVIFTSDNGGLAVREGPNTPPTTNAPLREGKGWVYEGGIRVPLIVRWPGKIEPGIDQTPAWAADIPLTIAGLRGLPAIKGLDGESLSAELTGGKPPEPRAFYWHYPHYSNQLGKPSGAIRDGDWKLVEFFENGRLELFNLARDRSESINLAAENPEKTRELAAKLASWRERVGARFPRPNPDYAPNPQARDGSITLAALTAEVHGSMLRFEPAPHKNTLGFWVKTDDWASWEFEVSKPGEFEIQALIGCGPGSGGSVVEFRLGDQARRFSVPVTGGFQNFVKQAIGRVSIAEAGRKRLEIRAISKPGPAVMDVREVKLIPIGEPAKIPRGLFETRAKTTDPRLPRHAPVAVEPGREYDQGAIAGLFERRFRSGASEGMENVAMQPRFFQAVALVGLVFGESSIADDPKLKFADCPEAVRKALQAEAPEARIETVTKEKEDDDDVLFWADLVIGGKTYAVGVLQDGTLAEMNLAVEGDETLPLDRSPAAVQETFRSESFGEKVPSVSKDLKYGIAIYEAVVSHKGKSFQIVVAEDGTLVEKVLVIDDEEVDLAHCPVAVQTALKKHARGGVIDSITRSSGIGKPTFEAEVEARGKVYLIEVDDSGSLISKSLQGVQE